MVVQNTSFASQDELEMPFESSNSNDEDEAVDPFMYCSARYFAFSTGTYDLMVKDLSRQVKVTLQALRDVEGCTSQSPCMEVHEELSHTRE